MQIDWNSIRDGAIAVASTVIAIHTLTRRGKADALTLALAESTTYKQRVVTLEGERKADREELAVLRAHVAELSGKIKTYENLMGGKELSPAMVACFETLGRSFTEGFARLSEQMDSQAKQLAAIATNTHHPVARKSSK